MDLRVNDRLTIPEGELRWTFTTSGGPGGQHANRSATRAELRFDVAGSPSMDPSLRERLVVALGRDEVVVTADESRSQWYDLVPGRQRC